MRCAQRRLQPCSRSRSMQLRLQRLLLPQRMLRVLPLLCTVAAAATGAAADLVAGRASGDAGSTASDAASCAAVGAAFDATRFRGAGALGAQAAAASAALLVEQYAAWHRARMARLRDTALRGAECGQGVVLFHALQGIGDTADKLATAFLAAACAGRLFFVDWTALGHHWSVGLAEAPGFDWDWGRAVGAGLCPEPRALVPEAQLRRNAQRHGAGGAALCHAFGATFATPCPRACVGGGGYWARRAALRDALLPLLVRPSATVRTQMAPTLRMIAERGGAGGAYVVALQIRAGRCALSRTPYLDAGDELRFLRCFEGFVRAHAKQIAARGAVAFLSTDTVAVERALRAAPGGAALVYHAGEPCHVRQQRDVKCRAKAYTDFFLLSRADVVLHTHRSYFGKVAAKVGRAAFHVISKGSCTADGKPHTPERCAQPPQPGWCLPSV